MTAIETLIRLQSRKGALGQSRLASEPLPPLPDGEITVRIGRFAITTNNVTYLTFGEAPIHYWSFFPTGDADWAQMPVWGFADVVESSVAEIPVGERYYGFLPIANVLRMRPQRLSERGFFDGMPHRQSLTSAYNFYTRCSADPAYSPALENYQALLRPLFVTSWMLADYLQDNAFFGAQRLVVSSASSKTAYAAADWLHAHADVECVALTSAGNLDFVAALGCYARALAYDRLGDIAPDRPTLYLDFSGDAALRARVHGHFGEQLVHDCLVGFTQTTEMQSGSSTLPGPRPAFFFAPEQIRKRTQDWGAAGYNERFSAAERGFIGKLSDPGNDWMHVVEHDGFESAQALIADLVAGNMDPRAGHIVRMPSTMP
ncbi:DUF2855 family protein [Dokdonella immobilis]|uniref:DUF2855 domain-containing protein n=1 Tax=Dokdonella immobilis TaxID=578942 RepID=A0A1I4Y665_9GAMM|nr:DUF2855 family protein [Dokdonella immobilis]SFN33537.1 Protein of unknown function [Dokdonella immobilis]